MEFTLIFLDLFWKILWLLAPLFFTLSVVIFSCGLLAGKLERWSLFDSFYWALITATTVGYGDLKPAGRTARILAICIAFAGLIHTGLLVSASIAAATRAAQAELYVESKCADR